MRRQVDNRRRALGSRWAIDDAIGVVQQQTGCSADEAFTQLWTQAERDETRLWEVATRLVAGQDPSSA